MKVRRPDRSEIASATLRTAGSCPGTRHPIPPRLLPSHNHGPWAMGHAPPTAIAGLLTRCRATT